jgi:magnesium transporter
MVKYYRTDDRLIHEKDRIDNGVWIHMVDPSAEESQLVADALNVDVADIRAALDEEESARIELEDGYTLILVDVPATEIRHDKSNYTTIPLGIILTDDVIVTVCTEDLPVLQTFITNRVKEFSTKKKLRFVYQILYRISVVYQGNLRTIDKRRTEIEERVGNDTREDDLIALHELESTLVYFATSLRANANVLDRLTRYKRLEQYPEDKELLDDVIIENKQAIEMAMIYRDIINGTRELMSSVMDNRLNNVMKYLTSITLIMAVPTVVSGLYGMNVNKDGVPLADSPFGFGAICLGVLVVCGVIFFVLKKKKVL